MPYIESDDREKRVGLELFFTETPGIEGRLKKTPEDFIVRERSIEIEPISETALATRDPTLPLYTYARVRSRNWETNRLIQVLSKRLGISYDKIAFAGTKDKRAITEQLMAFEVEPERLKAINLDDVEIFDICISPRVLKIGDLYGNDFEIRIMDIKLTEEELLDRISSTEQQLAKVNGFPNFFGIQRFGVIRPVTQDIGKLLVQKKFEDAILAYIGNPMEGEPEKDYEVRAEFDRCWDLEWAIENYPKYLNFERIMINYLIRHPEDYIGALDQLPKNLCMMFIHAYQSYLFNKMVCARIRNEIPLNEPVQGDIVLPIDDHKLPVHKTWIPITERNHQKLIRQCRNGKAFVSGVLYGSETPMANGAFGEIEQQIIEEEGLSSEDFIIAELPKISSKGSRREIIAPVLRFEYEIKSEYVKMHFGLIKGSYATTLLREYLKGDIRNY